MEISAACRKDKMAIMLRKLQMIQARIFLILENVPALSCSMARQRQAHFPNKFMHSPNHFRCLNNAPKRNFIKHRRMAQIPPIRRALSQFRA